MHLNAEIAHRPVRKHVSTYTGDKKTIGVALNLEIGNSPSSPALARVGAFRNPSGKRLTGNI
jgi:hypothetical protein